MRTWLRGFGLLLGGVFVLAACSGTADEPTEIVLQQYHDEVIAGDVEAAMDVLAQDAEWGFEDIRFTLDTPMHEQYEWLVNVFAVEPDATGLDVVRAYTEYLVASRATPVASNCVGDEAAVTCTYTTEDGLTPLTGATEFGTVEAAAADGRLTRYLLVTDRIEEEATVGDAAAFRRWSAIRDPETMNPFVPTAPYAERLVEAHDDWIAAGRPDVAPAVVLDDPIEVAEAWFAANNTGDWETQVSLTGGDALFDPFISRDEFEAARTLNRQVSLDTCAVTLEATDSVRIACDVTVTDIVTAAAGVPATNPNQTSMAMSDGRIVGAPQFLPSHFAAEREIEKWAQREEPENYRRACPEGIAGQNPITGLVCARFVATYQGEWAPFVAELGLGSSD